MSTSESPQRPFQLVVDTGSPATELFLVNHAFELEARGVGMLDVRVAAGVYKVKARCGREEAERLVVVEGDQRISMTPPAPVSAVPLASSTSAHPLQTEAAERESGRVHRTAGRGAQIFLFVREWGAESQPRNPDRPPNPARAIKLRDARRNVIVDLEQQGSRSTGAGAWAACTVEVDPGSYFLGRRTRRGALVEQAIVASPDWQTQVFLMRDRSGPRPRPRGAYRSDLSIAMRRGPFRASDDELRLAEIARLALIDDRPIYSSELDAILDGKFENPMLGILGGHVLLNALDRTRNEPNRNAPSASLPEFADPGHVAMVVANLRSMLGREHPDVEALSLRCLDEGMQTQAVLRSPPMLRRSWTLYVHASNARPDLIALETWNHVRNQTSIEPFFTWRRTRGTNDPAADVIQSMQRNAARHDRTSAPEHSAVADGDAMRHLSVSFGIPRAALDGALEKSRTA